MSVSGLFLVLFLLFHMSMNLAAVFSTEAYNAICEFTGANWYALAGTLILAAGVVVHLVYATVLTLHNRSSRGSQRYAMTAEPEGVTWASRNMYVLGIIIVLGLLLHLYNYGTTCSSPRSSATTSSVPSRPPTARPTSRRCSAARSTASSTSFGSPPYGFT